MGNANRNKNIKSQDVKYGRPDSCEMMRVLTRLSGKHWNLIKRRNDVKITNILKTCAAVSASLAYTLDMVRKDQSSNDLDTSQTIRYVADAMAMLSHINTDVSLLGRELTRLALIADYRNQCNPDRPVTSLLFGDDLQKKDQKKTSMIGSKVSSNYHNYDRSSSLHLSNDGSDLTTIDRGSFFGEVARKPESVRNITSRRKQESNNPSD